MRKIFVVLLVALLAGCSPKVNKEELKEELKITFDEDKLILDNGALFDPLSAITESVGNVSFPEIGIDTTKEGEFEFTYTLTHENYDDVKREVSVTYEVLEPINLVMKGEEFFTHLGDDINTDIFIKEYSGILTKPEYIDVYVEGSETKYSYSVTNRSGTEMIEKEILIKVADMTPTINGASAEFKVTAGNTYSFDKITATDFYGNPLEVEVVGDWNSKKVGRYPLQYRAVDSELREVVYDFMFVTVAKPSTGNSGNSNNSNSGNNNTGSTNAGNTNTGNSNTGNGGGGSETTYACPNAVYDKNLPCDAIVGNQSIGEIQFSTRSSCEAYGNEKIENFTAPENATNYACWEYANNMGEIAGVGFKWIYK